MVKKTNVQRLIEKVVKGAAIIDHPLIDTAVLKIAGKDNRPSYW